VKVEKKFIEILNLNILYRYLVSKVRTELENCKINKLL